MEEALKEWNITENIHVVTENAPNIVKGMKELEVTNELCFIHTLQLVIKDGIFSQRAVKDLISICRKIVGHFSLSAVASTKLSGIQKSQKLSVHKLLQDIETR